MKILLETRDVGIGERSTIEIVEEEGQAAVGKNKEVDLTDKLALSGRRSRFTPYEDSEIIEPSHDCCRGS
jgi:hypothetical protein